ncbi:hypothetical protein G4V62_02425 [Bacillaceae bacterium SIJ1]|uniref:hypothetical protein n=1 Tax=Litoribacterium kuwaitense TaxID=1398745 RepID=UPI0013ECDA66|nr:hypothetical protein [Litoribacterium kuwaitense]NGP43857.1 hypothetical protein [Litoribacterium kuwaitense]
MSETRRSMIFLTKDQKEIRLQRSKPGHDGGDGGIMRDFLHEVTGFQGEQELTSAETSAESHMMTFAAEHSRKNNGESVDLFKFRQQVVNQAVK